MKRFGFRRSTIMLPIGADGASAHYMTRWELALGWFGSVRLHHILRSDADRELHDHPFSFLSWIVSGWYVEELGGCRLRKRRGLFSFAWRHHACAHRIAEISPGGVWTFLWTTPRIDGEWGFYTDAGWVERQKFEAALADRMAGHA